MRDAAAGPMGRTDASPTVASSQGADKAFDSNDGGGLYSLASFIGALDGPEGGFLSNVTAPAGGHSVMSASGLEMLMGVDNPERDTLGSGRSVNTSPGDEPCNAYPVSMADNSAPLISSSVEPPKTSPTQLESMYREKYMSLRTAYESRLTDLSSLLTSLCTTLANDAIVTSLGSDPTSAPFLSAHLCEVLSNHLNDHRELFINKLVMKHSENQSECAMIIRNLRSENALLKANHEKEILSLKDSRSDVSNVIQEQMAKISSLESSISSYKQDNATLARRLEDSLRDKKILEESCESSVREISSIVSMEKQLRQQLQHSVELISSLRHERDALLSEVSTLRAALNSAVHESERAAMAAQAAAEEDTAQRAAVIGLVSSVEKIVSAEAADSVDAVAAVLSRAKQTRQRWMEALSKERRRLRVVTEELAATQRQRDAALLSLENEKSSVVTANNRIASLESALLTERNATQSVLKELNSTMGSLSAMEKRAVLAEAALATSDERLNTAVANALAEERAIKSAEQRTAEAAVTSARLRSENDLSRLSASLRGAYGPDAAALAASITGLSGAGSAAINDTHSVNNSFSGIPSTPMSIGGTTSGLLTLSLAGNDEKSFLRAVEALQSERAMIVSAYEARIQEMQQLSTEETQRLVSAALVSSEERHKTDLQLKMVESKRLLSDAASTIQQLKSIIRDLTEKNQTISASKTELLKEMEELKQIAQVKSNHCEEIQRRVLDLQYELSQSDSNRVSLKNLLENKEKELEESYLLLQSKDKQIQELQTSVASKYQQFVREMSEKSHGQFLKDVTESPDLLPIISNVQINHNNNDNESAEELQKLQQELIYWKDLCGQKQSELDSSRQEIHMHSPKLAQVYVSVIDGDNHSLISRDLPIARQNQLTVEAVPQLLPTDASHVSSIRGLESGEQGDDGSLVASLARFTGPWNDGAVQRVENRFTEQGDVFVSSSDSSVTSNTSSITVSSARDSSIIHSHVLDRSFSKQCAPMESDGIADNGNIHEKILSSAIVSQTPLMDRPHASTSTKTVDSTIVPIVTSPSGESITSSIPPSMTVDTEFRLAAVQRALVSAKEDGLRSQKEASELRNQLEEMKKSLSIMEEQTSSLRKQLTISEATSHTATEKLTELSAKLLQLQEKSTEEATNSSSMAAAVVATLESRIIQLTTELQSAKQFHGQLEMTIRELQSDLREERQKVEIGTQAGEPTLRTTIEGITSQLESTKAELESAHNARQEAELRVNKLETIIKDLSQTSKLTISSLRSELSILSESVTNFVPTVEENFKSALHVLHSHCERPTDITKTAASVTASSFAGTSQNQKNSGELSSGLPPTPTPTSVTIVHHRRRPSRGQLADMEALERSYAKKIDSLSKQHTAELQRMHCETVAALQQSNISFSDSNINDDSSSNLTATALGWRPAYESVLSGVITALGDQDIISAEVAANLTNLPTEHHEPSIAASAAARALVGEEVDRFISILLTRKYEDS